MVYEFIVAMLEIIKYLEFVFFIDTELYYIFFSAMIYSINTPQHATSIGTQNEGSCNDGDSHDHDELREKLCSCLCLKLIEGVKWIKEGKKGSEG
jgi:hypothetical protein